MLFFEYGIMKDLININFSFEKINGISREKQSLAQIFYMESVYHSEHYYQFFSTKRDAENTNKYYIIFLNTFVVGFQFHQNKFLQFKVFLKTLLR